MAAASRPADLFLWIISPSSEHGSPCPVAGPSSVMTPLTVARLSRSASRAERIGERTQQNAGVTTFYGRPTSETERSRGAGQLRPVRGRPARPPAAVRDRADLRSPPR